MEGRGVKKETIATAVVESEERREGRKRDGDLIHRCVTSLIALAVMPEVTEVEGVHMHNKLQLAGPGEEELQL